MDDNHVDRTIVVAGALDHPLKLRPMVVHGRSAGLDIFGDDMPAPPRAIGARLRLLIRNGEIDLRLPRRRDPKIERGADGISHEKLQSSLPGPEKRVEQITEKRRQHIHLGGDDRNLLQPIIDDNSIRLYDLFRTRIIPLRRANAIAISVMDRGNLTASVARTSHAAMMGASTRGANGSIPRRTTMRAIEKEKKTTVISGYSRTVPFGHPNASLGNARI
jgi:hypothetical protein